MSTRTAEPYRNILTPGALRKVYRHAREAYPSECCGMILASGTVRRCHNAQDEYHAADPDSFPQTARNGYCFSVDDQLFLARSQEGADPVRIVYHSHPDVGAYFSRADRDAAMCGDGPAYPGLLYLVIDCRRNKIGGAALYGFRDGAYRRLARFDGRAAHEMEVEST
jgi:proteasome lid subunit RPN8/RPN11